MELSPTDRDLAIRTILGEEGSYDGQAGVAAVILNRLEAGTYGDTLSDVVLSPGQFEPWDRDPYGLLRIAPSDPRYGAAGDILDAIERGEMPDPTNGATHFYAPDAQAKLGRVVPAWAKGNGMRLGQTLFYAPQGRVQRKPDEASRLREGLKAIGPSRALQEEGLRRDRPPAFLKDAKPVPVSPSMPDRPPTFLKDAKPVSEADPKGTQTLSAYEPSWTDRIRAAGQDTMSWLGASKGYSQEFGGKLANVAGNVPVLGNVLSGNEAWRDYQAGNPIGAAINAAGSLAMFAGPMARTADMVALDTAKAMAAAGRSAHEIRDATAWFRDAAGDWKFEAPDYGAKWKEDAIGKFDLDMKPGDKVKLSEILDHPELFSAYPHLRDMEVSKLPYGHNNLGQFDPFWNEIGLRADMDRDKMLDTLLHEIQHSVQAKEGFQFGSNSQFFQREPVADPDYSRMMDDPELREFINLDWKSNRYEISRWYDLRDKMMNRYGYAPSFLPDKTLAPTDAYRRTAGEVEARNVSKRRSKSPLELMNKPPWETQDVPNRLQLLRDPTSGAWGLARSKGPVEQAFTP